MEQVALYAWLFVGAVVYIIDTLIDWLNSPPPGLTSFVLIFTILWVISTARETNTWSIDTEARIEAIERKLGIERTLPANDSKRGWWSLPLLFVLAMYVLGKSLESESLLVFAGGIAVSGFFLVICGFGAYCFIDEWRRKRRETQRRLDIITDAQAKQKARGTEGDS